MSRKFRLATESDAEAIADIYLPIVQDTVISFETEPPDSEAMRQRIAETIEFAPWIVCDSDDGLIGYAYASRLRHRPAYRWSVEGSVYLRADGRRQGAGYGLMVSLIECLRLQGYHSLYGAVALPNPASERTAEKLGMGRVGTFPRVGYKMGAWHDVGWWHMHLRPQNAAPGEVKTPTELVGTDAWLDAIKAGARHLTDD